MGATAALEFGIRHPDLALSLTAAAAGGGATTDPAQQRRFHDECMGFADRLEQDGIAAMARSTARRRRGCNIATRIRAAGPSSSASSPRGSARGHALTMRGVQARRVPFFERAAELRAIPVPVLVIAGDEDDSTLDQALFLKRHIPRCGLVMLPRTGHTINLEEPAKFNAAVEDFIHTVERGRWGARDTRESFVLMPRAKT